MVIDTSAIVAIALNEPDAEALERKIVDAPLRLMSAASLLELTMVIETRLGEAGAAELDLWLHKAGVEITPVDVEQVYVARRAWREIRQGTASCQLELRRLLFLCAGRHSRRTASFFKGEDFSRTDIEVA